MQWQGQQEEVAKQQAAEEAKAKAEAEQQEEAAKQHAAEEAKAKAEAHTEGGSKATDRCGSQAKEEGEAQAGGASRFVKEHT